MTKFSYSVAVAVGVICSIASSPFAFAEKFNIPPGDLAAALDAYTAQTHVELIVSEDAVRGARTQGAKGDLSAESALAHILQNTGFGILHESNAIAVVRTGARGADIELPAKIAASEAPTASGASLETVTVTSSKIGGDVQNIPISITALSQEQLTATQTAGGPD